LAYRVKISDSALIDAEDYVQFIRQSKREPKAADRWFRGFVSAVFSLADLPSRCPLIPEIDDFPFRTSALDLLFASNSDLSRRNKWHPCSIP
jgi:hypothetical protein